VYADTPRGVRPHGRVGAAALAALSVLATGGVILATPGAAYAVDVLHRGQLGTKVDKRTIVDSEFSGPTVSRDPVLTRVTHAFLAVDKPIVLSGQSIVLTGKLTYGASEIPARSQSVQLEVGAGGAWKTVGSALANVDGSVTFTVKPTASTKYRLSYAGIRTLGASVSPVQDVTVKFPPPAAVVRRTTVATSSSWAPAGVSQIGSNHRAASSTGAAVVAAAAAQSGKPYVFGAVGPSSFDCSGLTMFVYAQFGVRLPHFADSQKNYGTPVSAADAAPGDLIVFLDGGYGYHAGIYAGGNQMYDAPHAGATVGRHTIWSTNVVFRRLV
jgi:peptidoglycan DL-endopeptidase CwlO